MSRSRMIEAPGANHAEAVVPLRLSSGDLLRGLGCGIDVTRPLLGILHEGHFVRGVPSILRPATDDEHDWIKLAGATPARHFGEQSDRTEHIDVVGGRAGWHPVPSVPRRHRGCRRAATAPRPSR